MKNLYFFLGLMLFISSCTSCYESNYFYNQIDIPLSLSSEQSTYSLDDTLWISTTFDYEADANVISLFPLDLTVKGAPVDFVVGGLVDTSSLIIHHDETSSNIFFHYGCPLEIDTFKINLGIVFRESGIYALKPLQKLEYFSAPDTISCDSLGLGYYFEYGQTNYFFDVEKVNANLVSNAPNLANEKNILDKKEFIFKVD